MWKSACVLLLQKVECSFPVWNIDDLNYITLILLQKAQIHRCNFCIGGLFWCLIEHYRHWFRTRYKRSTNTKPAVGAHVLKCVFKHKHCSSFYLWITNWTGLENIGADVDQCTNCIRQTNKWKARLVQIVPCWKRLTKRGSLNERG